MPARVALPLFSWPVEAELAALDVKRRALQTRIEHLPPRSYRRIVLEARLAAVTAEQLAIETRRDRLS